MTGEATWRSRELVAAYDIEPEGCYNCGQSNNFRGPTTDGTTEATDDGDLIWQCNNCGHHTALSQQEIKEKAEASKNGQ